MEGMLFLWFILTMISLIYVTVDLYQAHGDRIIKLGWWFSLLFTGPLGLVMYIVINKTKEKPKTIPLWKKALAAQVLVFSVIGFGMGLICLFLNSLFLVQNASFWMLFLEYLFGLGFGLFVYQRSFFPTFTDSLFRSHFNAFIAQFIFVNALAAGFFGVQLVWNAYYPESRDIELIYFWGMLSVCYLVGALTLFPFVLWQYKKGFVQTCLLTIEDGKKTFVFKEEKVKNLNAWKLRNKILWSALVLIAGIFFGFLWARQVLVTEFTSPFYF